MRGSLPERFEAHWRKLVPLDSGARVAVALSGGLDSLALLHLLRFASPGLDVRVEAAHFDHRMRKESGDDAAWARGVAGAWNVPFHLGRADVSPRDAAGARELRYRFFEDLLRREGVDRVLTAHHADDQAETVLLRIFRGTGVEGLRGIPAYRAPGIARPLLAFTRSELEGYARRRRIRPREDPSNRSPRFARNRLRDLLPRLEEVQPGARGGVLRLARNAERVEAALDALVEPLLEGALVERREGRVVLDRDRLLATAEPVRPELLRSAARLLGARLSEVGTADGVQFITEGRSGASLSLSGGIVLGRDFDRIRLERSGAEGDEPGSAPGASSLKVAAPGEGEGRVVVGGRMRQVRWGPGVPDEPAGWTWARFDPGGLRFPLTVRGWEAGDRTVTAGGTKKLKKLFGELRVPVARRRALPVVADARGRIVWIPGWHRAGPSTEGGAHWSLGVSDADER